MPRVYPPLEDRPQWSRSWFPSTHSLRLFTFHRQGETEVRQALRASKSAVHFVWRRLALWLRGDVVEPEQLSRNERFELPPGHLPGAGSVGFKKNPKRLLRLDSQQHLSLLEMAS